MICPQAIFITNQRGSLSKLHLLKIETTKHFRNDSLRFAEKAHHGTRSRNFRRLNLCKGEKYVSRIKN